MPQIGTARQRLHARIQLLRNDRGGGAGILRAAQELAREVHRIERDDDRVGAQDRVVGDHELGAVLHEQQHPLAPGDAAVLLQVTGQSLGFLV